MQLRALTLTTLATLGLASAALTSPALAADEFVVARCESGGCTCALSKISLDDVAVITGIPNPPGAKDMVLVDRPDGFSWTTLLPDELDRQMGGDGRCPIELFDIQPEDGTWKGSVRVQKIDGCLPQVAEMVPPLVDEMGYTKQIAWGGSFDPSKFVVGNAPDAIRWTRLSPTQFDGVFPIPKNDTLEVSANATATLTEPDKAEATLALRIAAKGENAAAMAMIGMADCRVDAIYDFERVGP